MDIDNRHEKFRLTLKMKRILRKIAEKSCRSEGFLYPVMIGLLFVNNEEMTRINGETRNIHRVTDVLSFPMLNMVNGKVELKEEDFTDGKNTVYLGDIVIAPDVVEEQGKAYGHGFTRELGFLFSHGMFHLLGYDHMDSENEKIMMDKQEEVLSSLKITR
ncbi:MAG: rRNA maturation RNase YbeY [Clostridia bacterium]